MCYFGRRLLGELKKELILIWKCCIIILEKEEAGTGYTHFFQNGTHFKSGWSAIKQCRQLNLQNQTASQLHRGAVFFITTGYILLLRLCTTYQAETA